MQKKLNEGFIDGYSEKFATMISSDFFQGGKSVISGKEILKVTPSKQVNFFVIKLLFRFWQKEIKKLESPFFNYKHAEVKQAMVQFMNVISQHIEIEQDRFELLLNHAVKDTIYLAAMPQVYVRLDLDSRGVDKILEKAIGGTVKYLQIYKEEIFNFLTKMKGLTLDELPDELPDEFDTTEVVGELCKLLNPILEISIEKIYAKDSDIDNFDEKDLLEPDVEDLVNTPFKSIETVSDSGAQKEKVTSADEGMKEVNIEDETKDEPIVRTDDDQALPKRNIEPPVLIEQGKKEDESPEETINQQFENEESTLAEHHEENRRSNNILELISLNHRYMFIKELFKNDKNDFERALDELEIKNSFDESVKYLVQSYAKHNEWDMQSDEVKEFLKVLFRRFR